MRRKIRKKKSDTWYCSGFFASAAHFLHSGSSLLCRVLGKVRFAPHSCVHDDMLADEDIQSSPPLEADPAALEAGSAIGLEEEEEQAASDSVLTSTQR